MPDHARQYALFLVGALFLAYGIYNAIMGNHRRAFFGSGIGVAMFLFSFLAGLVAR